MKTMIVDLAGGSWAISPEDAVRLLEIASRCRSLTYTKDYRGKKYDSNNDYFASSVSWAELVEEADDTEEAALPAAPRPYRSPIDEDIAF